MLWKKLWLKSRNPNLIRTTILALIGLIVSFQLASAAAPEYAKKKKSQKQRFWGLTLKSEISANTYQFGDIARTVNSTFYVYPSLNADYFILRAYLSAVKQLSDERKTLLNDALIRAILTPLTLNRTFELTTLIDGILPLSERSNDIDNLRFGAAVSPTLLANFNSIGLKGVTSYYSLKFFKNFHAATTSQAGAPLKSWGFQNSLGIAYQPFKWLEIEVAGLFVKSYSYRNKEFDNFTIEQTVTFNVYKGLSLYMSHQNGGDAVMQDGQSSNIAIVDDDASNFSLGVSYRF